jgi:hypothetical protein
MIFHDFMDHYLAIAIGLERHEVVNVYGKTNTNNIFASDELFIWSTSEGDNENGSGAKEITIKGIDITYTEHEQTIELNGLSPVRISDFLGINEMYVERAGDFGYNLGIISVGIPGIANKQLEVKKAVIFEGKNVYYNASYSVPISKRAYITTMHSIEDKIISLTIKESDSIIKEVNKFKSFYKYKVPLKVRGGSDIMLKSEEPCYAGMQIILIEGE